MLLRWRHPGGWRRTLWGWPLNVPITPGRHAMRLAFPGSAVSDCRGCSPVCSTRLTRFLVSDSPRTSRKLSVDGAQIALKCESVSRRVCLFGIRRRSWTTGSGDIEEATFSPQSIGPSLLKSSSCPFRRGIRTSGHSSQGSLSGPRHLHVERPPPSPVELELEAPDMRS